LGLSAKLVFDNALLAKKPLFSDDFLTLMVAYNEALFWL